MYLRVWPNPTLYAACFENKGEKGEGRGGYEVSESERLRRRQDDRRSWSVLLTFFVQ